ncbi:MAG: hypothetical protein AMS27_15600 [Bacteroides sp. SM23_62_1]|nr:MAG: hypothetical protein AMS27_15600 [Bacteroides sp. SM23_62_1]
MTFPAGEIAPGLIYREIVFRPREMNRGDKAVYIPIFIFQCSLTCGPMLSVYFDKTASESPALFY